MSSVNSTTIESVRVHRVCWIANRWSSVAGPRVPLEPPDVDRGLQGSLRRLARGELDVGRGDHVAGRDQRVEIDPLDHRVGHVALPDRPAGRHVRRADRDDVVEHVLQLGDVGDRRTQRARQTGPLRRQPGGENLDERPAQPGRDGLGEGGPAGPRRPEQHHGPWFEDAGLLGEIGSASGNTSRRSISNQRDDPLETDRVAGAVPAVGPADHAHDADPVAADRGQDLGQSVDRVHAGLAGLFPDPDDLIEVVVVQIAHPRVGHRHLPVIPGGLPPAAPTGAVCATTQGDAARRLPDHSDPRSDIGRPSCGRARQASRTRRASRARDTQG